MCSMYIRWGDLAKLSYYNACIYMEVTLHEGMLINEISIFIDDHRHKCMYMQVCIYYV